MNTRTALIIGVAATLTACVGGSSETPGGYFPTAAVDAGGGDGSSAAADTAGTDSVGNRAADGVAGTSSSGADGVGSSSSSGGSSSGASSGTSSSGADASSSSGADTTSSSGADASSSSGASSSGAPSTVVDKACIDGQYTEALPPNSADIKPLMSSYNKAKYKDFLFAVLDKRYPFGKTLVQDAPVHPQSKQDCIDTFLGGQNGTAQQLLNRIGVFVHECGHFYDTMSAQKRFAIKPGLTFACKAMGGADSKLAAYAGPTPHSFPRSLITTDKWSAKHPPCANFSQKGCDSYAKIYLDGDPNNGKFESGDQGFNLLFEEIVQYVNSLATGYAFADKYSSGSSHSDRDGILNFFWYLERYLHMARTKYPNVHKQLLADKCWREVILTVWGRGWLFLDATKGMATMGIQDKKLQGLVMDPELLGEIALVRKAHGC